MINSSHDKLYLNTKLRSVRYFYFSQREAFRARFKRGMKNKSITLNETRYKLDLQFFAGEDKTEKPTSRKLSKAREEGQVAKSQEISTAAMFIFLFSTLKIFGGSIVNNMMEVFNFSLTLIQDSNELFTTSYMTGLIPFIFLQIIMIVSPIFIVAVLVGVISNLIQVKWKPTLKPIMPKFSKLNPIKGFKRMFSMKSIVELGKSLLKLAIIGFVIYGDVSAEYNTILILINMDLLQGVSHIADVCLNLGIKVGAWFIFIAAADYAYQKYSHIKGLKMSKQEVKDEYKNIEGDPKVKGKIKQKMREISMRRMMQDLPTADVIITNPTHYAVALKYDREKSVAPVVIAKGVDFLAKRIKDMGKDNNIELVENKPLAQALYNTVDVGREIPPELYQTVAEILAFVYSLKNA